MNFTHHTEPLAIDLLLTEDQRRTVTIDDHAEARQRIASEAAAAETKARQLDGILHPVRIAETDPVDLVVDHPPQVRSERETNRVLSILDELERGDG